MTQMKGDLEPVQLVTLFSSHVIVQSSKESDRLSPSREPAASKHELPKWQWHNGRIVVRIAPCSFIAA